MGSKKGFNHSLNWALSIYILANFCQAAYLYAQSRDQFFEKDSAKSTFSDKVLQSDSPGLEFFPVGMAKPGLKEIKLLDKTILERKEREKEDAKSKKLEAEKKPETEGAKPIDPKGPIEEQLRSKYGDPNEDQPILAMDNAPKPFAGMQEALQLGREDLAFQYARKYVRYLSGIQSRSMDVVGLVGKAMETEGLADANGWTKAEQFNKFNKLRDVERAHDEYAKLDPTKTLDDQARELVRKEIEEEGPATTRKSVPELARLAAKDEQIPVDPKGMVDIFFFFRPNDEKSIALSKQVEAIYQKSKSDKNINVVGLVLGSMQPDEINGFKSNNKTSFPIDGGDKLAKIFGVRSSPTVAFIARSTGLAYFETDTEKQDRLDEVLGIMRGRKARRE